MLIRKEETEEQKAYWKHVSEVEERMKTAPKAVQELFERWKRDFQEEQNKRE